MSRRDEILQLLRDRAEPMSIAEIAGELGVHVNTVRFHLDTLVETGRVEQATAERHGQGRPPQLFVAVRAMDPTGPRHYEMLAEVFAIGLAADGEAARRATDAGRAWGRRRTADLAAAGQLDDASDVDALMLVLDDLDFAPEVMDGDEPSVIGLRHCPFLDLAESRSDVVCPVHLGLMRGVLESSESNLTVDRLEPFVQPDLCAAHLATVGS